MQGTSVTAAGSACMCAAANQCPDLAGRICPNILASHEMAAVCVGPRNFVLRVGLTRNAPAARMVLADVHSAFVHICMPEVTR